MSPALQADSLPLSQGEGSPDGPHPLGWLLPKQRENDKCWPVVKMWRNQNLYAMLVGMHSIKCAGTDTMENSTLVPHKVKLRITV